MPEHRTIQGDWGHVQVLAGQKPGTVLLRLQAKPWAGRDRPPAEHCVQAVLDAEAVSDLVVALDVVCMQGGAGNRGRARST